MRKNLPASRNPLFTGEEGLQFDNIGQEELIELTDAQRADKFLSRWLEIMRPLSKYKRFFDDSDKEIDHNLKLIKNFFQRYVVEEGWDEKQFVMVVDYCLDSRRAISHKIIEAGMALYNKGDLPAQLLEKRKARRNRGRV